MTYVVAIIIGVFGLITVLLMQEPRIPKSVEAPEQTIRTIVIMAYRTLKNNRQLRGLMGFQALFDGVCTSYFFYFQSLMETHHFSGTLISLLMVISAGMDIIGIKLTPWIQKRLSKSTLVMSLSAALVCLLLLSWFNWIPGLTVLFLTSQLLGALIEPIFSSYYNELIDSEQRATLLSVASVLFSASMIVLFPLIGWLVQTWTFSMGFGL
ncbi:MAG: MFS transporter, partial [Lentilactobacillus parabuchneri]|nr:MFS transporter [Lentilactobacillus parabuchneri]